MGSPLKIRCGYIFLWTEVAHFTSNLRVSFLFILFYLFKFFFYRFQVFDVLRLWDSLFSHPAKLSFINYVCVAILLTKKEVMINSEFNEIMEDLKNFETINLNIILY